MLMSIRDETVFWYPAEFEVSKIWISTAFEIMAGLLVRGHQESDRTRKLETGVVHRKS